MKTRALLFIIGATIFCSCEKRKFSKDIVGIWFIQEFQRADGSKETGPSLQTVTIFGAYDPNVEFKKDKSYVPFIGTTKDEVPADSPEAGTYEYVSKGDKLTLTPKSMINSSGIYQFKVVSLTDNELLLETSGKATIKLRRDE